MSNFRALVCAAVGLACSCLVVGCGDDEEAGAKELKVYTPKGQVVMRYLDLVEGKGETVKKLDAIEVHYTGWTTGGTKFDSSYDRFKPFPVVIGAGKVIKGWDEGIPGMKVGGKRKLFIPGALAYGEQGTPDGRIKPNAKLIFEVEVLKIIPPDQFQPHD
jgi:FKBP-type peptidyl-prolyl cis-trans isomerase